MAATMKHGGKKKGYAFLFEPQFEIASWCPDANAEVPPEQVHFIIHWPSDMADLPPIAVRFHSPDTLGDIIDQLILYRRHVWPGASPICGETKIHERIK